MKTMWNDFKFKVRWTLGYVPFLRGVIFMDADAIFCQLEKDGVVEYIRDLRATERRLLHFSLGASIRNAFLLWHPQNPYTTLALQGLSDSNQASSPCHPDNYSWEIIRRLIVIATNDENTSISNRFDAAESLIYSLLVRKDDSVETLASIREAMVELVASNSFDLLDDVLNEALLLAVTSDKISVLLETVAGIEKRLNPRSLVKLHNRQVMYGVLNN